MFDRESNRKFGGATRALLSIVLTVGCAQGTRADSVAQTQPSVLPRKNAQLNQFKEGYPMTTSNSEKLAQLKVPETAEEMLLLLKSISDNFLLMDRAFYAKENLERLFKAERMQSFPEIFLEGFSWNIEARSLLHDVFSFRGEAKANFSKANRPWKGNQIKEEGFLDFRVAPENTPFTPSLIAQVLGAPDKSHDQYAAENNPFHRTPTERATHPWGHLNIYYIQESERYKSILEFRLVFNGRPYNISITQEEK